ncbi:MAG: acyltransferase domain-containing protein [Acidimicrobiales bacterium]
MLAFTFPGQGSQRPAMGAAWVGHPSWRLVEEASEVAGRDLARLLLEADADELRQTRNAQVATFVAGLVAHDAVTRVGVEPAACAGHSLGEYTALVAAGSLPFTDAVRVVVARAEAMQEAAEASAGTIAALIGLDDADAEAACRKADGEVWVANFNAPGQVVVAGSPRAVAAAGEAARGLGAKKVLPVPVEGAFHTPQMAPAGEPLLAALAKSALHRPRVPVVANVDARRHTDPDEWRQLLSAQLCSPVRWRQSVQRLHDDGVRTFVELGPGQVLTRIARRSLPGAQALSVSEPHHVDDLLSALDGEEGGLNGNAVHPEGEHLYIAERLVVSPAAGIFQPAERWRDTEGQVVDVGEVLGTVSGTEVRSRFAGVVMGLIAFDGERVTTSQPIAWLRTA